MRICMIESTEEKLRHGFRIESAGTVGAAEIQRLLFCRKRGKRCFIRAIQEVYKRGSTCFAVEEGLLQLAGFSGIETGRASQRRIENEKLAQMAVALAEDCGFLLENTRFTLRCGSFRSVYNAASELIRVSRHVVLDCVSASMIAEEILSGTGAVVRALSEVCTNCESEVVLSFSEEGGAELRSGEKVKHFSDFDIVLPEEYREIIPESLAAQVAAILISYGFMCADDVEIRLKNTENKF